VSWVCCYPRVHSLFKFAVSIDIMHRHKQQHKLKYGHLLSIYRHISHGWLYVPSFMLTQTYTSAESIIFGSLRNKILVQFRQSFQVYGVVLVTFARSYVASLQNPAGVAVPS